MVTSAGKYYNYKLISPTFSFKIMPIVEWNPLAQFYLYNDDFSEEVYCLCSRVFTWTYKESNEKFNVTEDIPLNQEADSLENLLSTTTTIKHSDLGEPVSCYCSSSHTDNISTDEHDSLNDICISNHNVGIDTIHLSDSGADLTDYVGGSDSTWQTYWSVNGERVIWESWISKYSAYINPDYLPSKPPLDLKVSPDFLNKKLDKQENTANVKFTFDSQSAHQDSPDCSVNLDFSSLQLKGNEEETLPQEIVERNRMLVRNLSGSDSYDKLYRECEGWNPLSPISNDCETEDERLLNSRCGSRTGSAARTVDSMTNVTRLTVSSIELSEYSKNSDSFSSVSSVHSSITSTSSEDIYEHTDYDRQWNQLWTTHYQEEYMKHYKKFILDKTDCTNDLEGSSNLAEKECKKQLEAKQTLKEEDYSVECNIRHEMNLMGLPSSFSNKSYKRNRFEPSKKANITLNQSSEISKQSNVKAGFSLLAIEMNENGAEKLKGSVEYKMKNIRAQNRNLIISKNNLVKGKHFHFDDNGDIINNESNNECIETSGNEVADGSYRGKILELHPSSSTEEEIGANDIDATDTNIPLDNTNKKKKRKRKSNLPLEMKRNPKLLKYWYKRYSLFHKFDEGIKLDEESWFSVTPELVAEHTAERCQCDIIIDAFCGAGGNTIQFAKTCNKVIAIDIDEKKIEMAKINAEIYGVADRIEFIVGDYFQLANSLKADVVFLSPPWGGPKYLSLPTYDLEMLKPKPLSELLRATKNITDKIALFLPKNSNTYPLVISAGPGGRVEFEQNFLNKKLIAITAYLGDLVKETSSEIPCA